MSDTVAPVRKRRRGAHVFSLAGGFNVDSGGRTMATLLRAGELARTGRIVHVLTVNHRLEYGVVEKAWRERLGLGDRVLFENFFEHLAGERVFGSLEDAKPFLPSGVVGLRKVKMGVWDRIEDGRKSARYVVRDDGSLNYVDHFAEGRRTRHDNFDRQGHRRVVTRFGADGRTAVSREFETASGRVYLTVGGGAREAGTLVVHGPDGSEVQTFESELHARRAWIAQLSERFTDSVFVVEDRRLDELVVGNDLAPHLATIAAIHSTHLRAPYDDLHRTAPYNSVALAQADRFSAVVLLTRAQASDVTEHFGRIGNAVTIPNPVQAGHGRGRVSRRGDTVVMVTRLASVKRIDHAIRAFAIARQLRPDARFEIWGTGPDGDELAQLVAELGLHDAVTFEGYTHDSTGVFASATVTISTSRSEGFGMSTLESLAAGTPVASYDYRYGPREMIVDGFNGRLVPDADVEALGNAVAKLLSGSVTRRLRSVASRLARFTYSRRRIRRRWSRLITSVAR